MTLEEAIAKILDDADMDGVYRQPEQMLDPKHLDAIKRAEARLVAQGRATPLELGTGRGIRLLKQPDDKGIT